MSDPEPPRVGDDALASPDGDPGRKDARLPDGARLTGAVADLLAEQIRQVAGRLPRPDLSGAPRPELMPLPELLGDLVADLRELRPRDRLAAGLRQLADAIERTKVH